MTRRRPPGPSPAAAGLAATRAAISLEEPALAPVLAGPGHRNLALIEDAFGVHAEAQGGDIVLTGPDRERLADARAAVEALYQRTRDSRAATEADARAAIVFARARTGGADPARSLALPGRRGSSIAPRSPTQSAYLEALRGGRADLVFGVGPAGTGKTFLACAVAVQMLVEGRVSRIVVTRPAVEAGERLGFLPGDLEEKVDPYLQPIWDAFKALLGAGPFERRRAAGEIEIAPLAFMRGRTLSDAFVIVDEAQNATRMQMKMLLTRLGEGSRMAVNGDPSQVDLPNAAQSGLAHALRLLRGVEGVETVHFGVEDVVRHPLVGRIVAAYEADPPRGHAAPFPDEPDDADAADEAGMVDVLVDEPGWTEALGDPQALVERVTAAVGAVIDLSGDSFSVLFANDAAVRALNATWRGQDKPTNVLSFPAPETAGTLGDLALAWETCVREAGEQGKSLHDHAAHLVAHGLLHLLGHDHQDEAEAEEMEGLERDILARMGVPDPYGDA